MLSFLTSVPFWLIGILILGILIIVHESGHFLIGRLLKFRIDEFSVGMGPALFSKEKKGIRYSLRAIPMGGYVAFHGEDGDNENDPEAMNNQPWYKRAPVMFAGAGFNILFSLLVTAILVCCIGYNAPCIASINADSPMNSVAQAKDVIYAVNGHRLLNPNQLNEYLDAVPDDQPASLTVFRDREKIEYTISRYDMPGEETPKFGFSWEWTPIKQNPIQAIGYSAEYNVWMTKEMYRALGQLITGKVGLENVTGPVSTIGEIGSIVEEVATEESLSAGERARETVVMIINLLVLISMNLAIMNLLPIPALDGFRLLLALIEGVTHRHLSRRVEGIVNTVGFLVLIGLMVVIEVGRLFV